MSLKFFLLPPSPNNVKVMLAAAIKGADYDCELVNPADRAAVVAATGQPLTPAMVHDGVKLFDSSAIVRYLDANLPGPRLYSEDYQTMKQIETWERYALYELGPFVGRTFNQLFAETKDPREADAISAGFNAATATLEEALADREYLVGDAPTAGDVAVAAYLFISCMSAEHAEYHEFWGWMRENLQLGEGRDKTRAWVDRMMQHLPAFTSLAG